MNFHQPPWRNWLARSAVNRKVGGSSPPGGEHFILRCYDTDGTPRGVTFLLW
jgi:hypothetical protein